MWKFRAWNKINKRMEEIDGCNLYLADGKIFEVYAGSFGYECTHEKNDVTDRYELMVYSGLRDNKRTAEYPEGQEIYQDDVVCIEEYYLGDSLIKAHEGSVIFYDGAFVIRNIIDMRMDEYLDKVNIHNYNIRVVGNIYDISEATERCEK